MKTFIPITLLLLALASTAHAQSYSIDWYQIGGGGGTSTGSIYTVSGTIGQADAGAMSGGNYSLTGGYWALAAAVQQPGAPLLFINQFGSNAVVSWAVSATPFVLERTGDLTTIGWAPVLPAPSPTNGFNYVTNTISPGKNFYRLRYP